MDKKKILKATITTVVALLPFGLISIGGYIAVKKYIESKKKDKGEK